LKQLHNQPICTYRIARFRLGAGLSADCGYKETWLMPQSIHIQTDNRFTSNVSATQQKNDDTQYVKIIFLPFSSLGRHENIAAYQGVVFLVEIIQLEACTRRHLPVNSLSRQKSVTASAIIYAIFSPNIIVKCFSCKGLLPSLFKRTLH